MANKTIRFGARIGNTTATTYPNAVLEGGLLTGYNNMDVVAVVNTLAGTTPNISIIVSEEFPTGDGGTIFIETGRFAGINATGRYFATYENNSLIQTYKSQQNSMFGKGIAKRISTTVTGVTNTVTDFSADMIFVFWN